MDSQGAHPVRRPAKIPSILPISFRPVPLQPLSQRDDLFSALHLQPLYDIYVRVPPEPSATTITKPDPTDGFRPALAHGRTLSGQVSSQGHDHARNGMIGMILGSSRPSIGERRRSEVGIKSGGSGPGQTQAQTPTQTGPEAPPSPSGSLDGNGKVRPPRVMKTRTRKFGRFWDDLLQEIIDVRLEDRRPTLQAILHQNYPPHLDAPNFTFEPITNSSAVRSGMRLAVGRAHGVRDEYNVMLEKKTGKDMIVKSGAMTANQRRKARNKANAQNRQTAPPVLTGASSPAQTPFPYPERERSNSMLSPIPGGGGWTPGFGGGGPIGGSGGGEYFGYSPGHGGGSPVGSPRYHVGSPGGGRTPTYGGATPR